MNSRRPHYVMKHLHLVKESQCEFSTTCRTIKLMLLEGDFGNTFENGLEKGEAETRENHLGRYYTK